MRNETAAREAEKTRWGDGGALNPREERELDEHLELVPYVDLGVAFDHDRCLAEALALRERFVPYQSDPRYGVTHWRGLALNALGGDPTRVAVANIGPGERFVKTPVAALCPTITAMLDGMLDWGRAHSVALLVLDPRSAIAPHKDDPQFEVMRSLNVALNMPDGCEFVIDTELDGRDGPFTRRIPFRAGTAMTTWPTAPTCRASTSSRGGRSRGPSPACSTARAPRTASPTRPPCAAPSMRGTPASAAPATTTPSPRATSPSGASTCDRRTRDAPRRDGAPGGVHHPPVRRPLRVVRALPRPRRARVRPRRRRP